MKKLLVIFLLLIGLNLFSQENTIEPLAIRNQYLFFLNHLQLVPESTRISPKENEVSLSYYKGSTHIYNYLTYSLNHDFAVDVETTTLSARFARNISPSTRIEGFFPFYYHGGGYLDGPIESWHKFFSFPNYGREYEAQDKIHIKSDKLSIDNTIYGMGDPEFRVKHVIHQGTFSSALCFAFKTPFVNKAFIGTNTLDLGISLINDIYFSQRLYMFSSIGFVYMIGKPALQEQLKYSKKYMIQLGYGLGFQLFGSLSIITQIFYETSPYKSGYQSIDRYNITHSFGLRWNISPDYTFQFSMDEDTFHPGRGTDGSGNLQLEARF